ncbi:MAG: DUF503 domain-containing protein [Acidobacteria bacterium]|nr:DUF503 domain-containing protein [Acidobacteriota bacterium]
MLALAMIPGSQSLKEKRMVLRSIKDRTRSRFNIAVSELDYQDKWQKTLLGFVTLGPSSNYCCQTLDRIENMLDEDSRLLISRIKREELA